MDKKRDTTTLSVHRCRFVDFAPSAITALAYPPLPLPSVKGKKKTTAGKQPLRFGLLAVGHANEHESQCSQAWVARKTLPGPYPSKVDSLAFAIRHPDDLQEDAVPVQTNLRLFSSGGGSELIEWDLERGCIRRTINSHGGSIWSIAVNPSSSSLALGCEDGTVRILSIANDTLTHSRRFDRVKCRMLSIAWGPPVPRQPPPKKQDTSADSSSESEDEEWADSWLVTGGSDSSLRKWDVSTGRVVERMGVDKVRGERTLVWTVGVLGDGTIISGDSLGMVKFWDSRTCTQLYSFQAHGADVLCMAISPEGKAIYTAGVDQKTVQFSLIRTSSTENSPSSTRWTQTCSRRMHSHDIRALAIWPPYTPLPLPHQRQFAIEVAPVLASGGLDMSVVLTPAALPTSTVVKVINPLNTSTESTFEDSYHRKLAYVVRNSVRVARSARLVSCAREAGLTVWRIEKKPNGPLQSHQTEQEQDMEPFEPEPFAGGWEKVLEMNLDVHSNITAHEFSDDGSWLVVSDLYESKLFSLRSNESGEILIKRVKDFSSILQASIPASSTHPLSTGAAAYRFTPDSSKLVVSTVMSSYVLIINLTGDKPRVLRRFDHHRMQDSIVRDRVIKGRAKKSVQVNGNGHIHVNGDGDVDMAEPGAESSLSEQDESDSEDGEDEDVTVSTAAVVNVDQIAVSNDGQWLATSDDHARTHIYNLDLISHHCVLPSFPRAAQALAFDPMHPSVLLLAFADNTVQIFDVETRQFPVWGKELSASLPKRFRFAHDPILGVAFDPAVSLGGEQGKTRYVLFWGATWLRREVPVAEENEERQWRDYKMITQYRPILACDFLTKDELVVVERPLVDVLLTLPPAYFKHKYGAS
ncbi:WD40-repeat-containing domain protein [Gymnopilus junonius]|uniref:WD40-repeat-containing domain protein n=1 Tax=Gymnopilus junonius TaxID=109634 RepID=A0A9P5NKB6_GYMJU|nr:WD40-repeat-containing domain protein [Gymnopilus junonius]